MSVPHIHTRQNPLIIDKRKVAFHLCALGFALNFFASIHVSLFWGIEQYIPVVTLPLFVLGIHLSARTTHNIFTRWSCVISCIFVLLNQFYQTYVNNLNINPYIVSLCGIVSYFALFSMEREAAIATATAICKVLGGFMVISVGAFILHLIGIPMPSHYVGQHDYYYTSYYLFLIDCRELSSLFIPRFNSIFLEPGHMGTCIALLLTTQMGKWKKWYNIALFVALFLSFSLAAYMLLVIMLFLRLWILRRKILGKLLLLVGILAAIVSASYIYKDGDNVLNQLIVSRMELNDSGDNIQGDNRADSSFQNEFKRFITTDDIWFGKDYASDSWGHNSGYRVFIYDYGLCGLILVLLFYFFAFNSGQDKRCVITAFILAMVNFWIRGYAMLFAFVFSYYIISQLTAQDIEAPVEQA